MKLLKINTETGMFIEDIILPGVPTITVNDQQVPDPQYITTPCPAGFYWPRWDGEQWVEGKTQEEIDAVKAAEPEPTDSEVLADLVQLLVDKGVIF